MKRGEVWWVNFDPSVGGEATKTRPAIIVSNNASNRHLNVSKLRLSSKIDTLSQSDMQGLEGAIQVQLELYSGY